jgi:hypothetical protein
MAADVPMVEADARPTPSLRVLIILDITGSMGHEITVAKSAVAQMVGLCSGMASADSDEEEEDQPSLEFAFITFTEDDNSGCHVSNPSLYFADALVAMRYLMFSSAALLPSSTEVCSTPAAAHTVLLL